jgi:hypothetical protein
MLRRERLDPVEREGELEVDRLLGPERAVVVEGGDALLDRNESALPSSVTRSTNATIACFAAPSFHDGSGSGEADRAEAQCQPTTQTTSSGVTHERRVKTAMRLSIETSRTTERRDQQMSRGKSAGRHVGRPAR